MVAVCFSTARVVIESKHSSTPSPVYALVKKTCRSCSLANRSAISLVTAFSASRSIFVATMILSTSSFACCSICCSHDAMLLKEDKLVLSKARMMPLAPR